MGKTTSSKETPLKCRQPDGEHEHTCPICGDTFTDKCWMPGEKEIICDKQACWDACDEQVG